MFVNRFFIKTIFFLSFFFTTCAYSSSLNKIIINGNDRISDETVKLFISVNVGDQINNVKLNQILNDLYDTNFFKDISVNFNNQTLYLDLIENPIIENISFKGIKSNRILDILKKETSIKSRSSFNEILFKKEKLLIENILKNLGYYNSNLDILIEEKKNNLIDITYEINLGKKSKIGKITFIGNKVFKDKKLRRVIASNEYKFWKIISGRKYLNQDLINFDQNLLNLG